MFADGSEAQERIGILGRPAGRRGEIPREGKAQEGRGLLHEKNIEQECLTLTGIKTLKWGELSEALLQQGSARAGLAVVLGGQTGRDARSSSRMANEPQEGRDARKSGSLRE